MYFLTSELYEIGFQGKKYKNVECILPSENLGYGAANNVGINKAKTKYLLILNPDTILQNNTLDELLISAKKIKNFAILGPKIIEGDKILVDTIKWNGKAKKDGFEMGDYITEFKIENSNRPDKKLIYPVALFLLLVFGYLNMRRTN